MSSSGYRLTSESLEFHLEFAVDLLVSHELRDTLGQLLLSRGQGLLHQHQLLLVVGQLEDTQANN